jgi:hypothetical protein
VYNSVKNAVGHCGVADLFMPAGNRQLRRHDQRTNLITVLTNLPKVAEREGSRASQFAALDKPALNPLPAERFDLSQWSRARVNIDYHIAFDTNYYSVPYNLVQELVEVRSTPTTVELFRKGQRVASHLRARGHGHTVTIAEHRPRSHQEHLE